MLPSQLQESSLIHFSTVVHCFIGNLHFPSGILNVELNSKIQHPTPMIPDFICMAAHKPGDYAVKWAGEICFAVSPVATRLKMKKLLADLASIDLAFIVYINKDHKWTSPDEEASPALKLRSKGLLSRADFLRPFLANKFYKKVNVEDFTWVSLDNVSFEVFLCHPVKGFDLESTDMEYVARGVGSTKLVIYSIANQFSRLSIPPVRWTMLVVCLKEALKA